MKTKTYHLLLDIIKTAEKIFIAEDFSDKRKLEILNVSGVLDILETMYITLEDSTDSRYLQEFFEVIQKFLKSELFSGEVDLNKDQEILILKDNRVFNRDVYIKINKIKKDLYPKSLVVLDYFEETKGNEISLENIINSLNIDRTSLLFILDDLKFRKDIYDYNGNKVTVKEIPNDKDNTPTEESTS